MKQIKYIVVASLIASTLSGCGIYSKFENPVDNQFVDSLYNYIEATNDTTNIATLSYTEFFNDVYLQELIEKALENNTDLNVARLNVDQAQASLKAARLAFLPSVSAAPQGAISSFNGTTTQTYNLSLTASWEIDLFGKLRNAKERSKAALQSSIAYRQAVQTQLVATIAEGYYTLLMLDEQLEISLQTQENWQENLRVMSAMKSAGRINETSVLQSEASSVALSSQIVSIKEEIAQMENTLSALLAMPTQMIKRGAINEFEFSEELSVGLPIQLLSNRPDIRMAENDLAQAFYATAESRSALYPTITLSGSAGYTNSSGVIINPGDMLYNAVGSLLQPIFNRGAIRAQIKISEAQQEQALLQFKQAVLDAATEVNNALSQCQHAQQRLELGTIQIELLEKTVTKTELLMKYGKVDYLDVLVAQLSLLQTELSYSTDKFNQIQGAINLYRALGGGSEVN